MKSIYVAYCSVKPDGGIELCNTYLESFDEIKINLKTIKEIKQHICDKEKYTDIVILNIIPLEPNND